MASNTTVRGSTPLATETMDAAAHRATQRIAPLWPLKHFVASNPFLGVEDCDFTQAARYLGEVAGARLTQARGFYAEAIASGRITDDDLAAALEAAPARSGLPSSVAGLRALAFETERRAPARLPTVTDVAGAAVGRDWSALAVDRISGWAGAYFDETQSAWRSPWRDLGPYAAWRTETRVDRSADLYGLRGFRQRVAELPEDPWDLIRTALANLELPEEGLEPYCHRLLMSIGGWAGYVAFLVREHELRGQADNRLVELLAIRLAWELAVYQCQDGQSLAGDWQQARARYRRAPLPRDGDAADADTLLQEAYERAWQRELATQLAGRPPAVQAGAGRAAVQAAFCIDVRSEVLRRALEAAAPEARTIGFAGFFGLPIEYVPLGQESGRAQCPALLAPQLTVREGVRGVDAEREAGLLDRRVKRLRAAKVWKSFKMAAVSSFSFVEALGLGYLPKLLTDSLGLTRTVRHPDADGLDPSVAAELRPRPGEPEGLSGEQRADMAAAILRGMGLTEGLARLVVITGHGSSSVNNPHATALDCGACGGHSGAANARVAADLLNESGVREGLAERGIQVPEDTVFLAALHDTTTDEVTLLDTHEVPESHSGDLERLRGRFTSAARQARRERAPALGVDPRAADRALSERTHDWSQVRPEWGLAGCAAFIAAPRHRTESLDLEGRAFLHTYDWRGDEDFAGLETIMTAPMVVATWIALQYYGSTVDNTVFGSGNKVLHNVVGATLGVLEGNGGDLRPGLPWQSVHEGERLIHEPVRLSVCIEAPIDAMNTIIERHPSVRRLVDNGWIHLLALDAQGRISYRYTGDLEWEELDRQTASRAA